MPSVDNTGSDGHNLPRLIFTALARHGDATVIRWKRFGLWQTMSGADLAARSEAMARALAARGFTAGDVAAVVGDNCAEWVQADLGIMAAGGVSAGLDAHGSADELARMLRLTGARMLFVAGDDALHKAQKARAICPDLVSIIAMHQQWNDAPDDPAVVRLQDFLPAAQAGALTPAPAEDAAAVIIVTSGHTGAARGAVLTHRAISAQARAGVTALDLRRDDERLSLTPIHHVMERVSGIYSALLAGTVINFPESAETALANLAELQPTVIQASPQLWARLRAVALHSLSGTTKLQRAMTRAAFSKSGSGLLDWLVLAPVRQRIGLGRARCCISTGAAAQPDVAAWFASIKRPLIDVYGQAETGGIVSLSHPADAARVTSPEGAALMLDGKSELLVRSAGLLVRYAGGGDVALSVDGWWRSGDIGVRDASGILRAIGRAPHLLHLPQGKLMQPFDSEQALRASPYIADAFISVDGAGKVRARILLDYETAVQFAQDGGIPFTHFESLCRAEEIKALIAGVVAEVNRTVSALRIDAFNLIERLPRPGDPELAPTLTLRRHLLHEDAATAPASRDMAM